MAFQLVLTTAGLAALVNAQNTGLNPVVITQIGLTQTAFAPTAATAAVPGEFTRLPTIAGDVVADNVIHLLAQDAGDGAYSLRGFGLYTDAGLLFATYGQATPLVTKTASSVMLLAIDCMFAQVVAGAIQFGDTDFVNPPATDQRAGVVELATPAEVQAGADNFRAVTPSGLASRTATETRTGIVELATVTEALNGADTSRAVTPQGMAAAIAAAVSAILNAPPAALDTLNELAAALGDDPNFAATVMAMLAAKAPLASPALTGAPTAPTPAPGTSNNQLATTAFVAGMIAAGAPDASTTQRGIVELATAAEVQLGADNERAITPAGMASRTATETRAGLVELATVLEAQTGADTSRAVTPAGMAAAISAAISAILNAPPAALDTLNELAAALGDDPNFATTMTNLLATKAPTASPTLTGVPKAPTAAPGTNTTQLATTAFVLAALAAATPDASATVRGLIELATSTEVQDGVDGVRAVTPATLAALIATVTRRGLVELATTAEAAAASDETRAVTPAGLAAYAPAASTSIAGKVELATTAETTAGTDSLRAVTPAGAAAAIAAAIASLPLASTTTPGKVELATNAEAAALTDAARALTPAALSAIFSRSLGASGYITLPGNLILQWGSASVGDDTGVTVSLPVTFPTAFDRVVVTVENSIAHAGPRNLGAWAQRLSNSQVRLFYSDSDITPYGPVTVAYFAIGR